MCILLGFAFAVVGGSLAGLRAVETLPFVDPIRDYTPSVMAAIQRQSGYSFQAPVVEVEAERLASLPRSITKANKRRITQNGTRNTKHETSPIYPHFNLREQVVRVFALVAAFMALVLSSFGSSAISIQGSALASDGSLVHAPVIGPLIARWKEEAGWPEPQRFAGDDIDYAQGVIAAVTDVEPVSFHRDRIRHAAE